MAVNELNVCVQQMQKPHTHYYAQTFLGDSSHLIHISNLRLMSDKQDGLIIEKIKNHSTKDGQCDVWVDGCEWVVEQVDVTVAVDGPCQTHSLPLTTAQRHTAVTDQRRVTITQSRYVHVKTARLNHRSVPVRQTTLCQYT